MELEIFQSLAIIFISSALVVFFLHKLKMSSTVGFIIAGGVIGPHGAGLIKDMHLVQILAEIGVVLLLFVIGIEFSMRKFLRMKKAVLGGGGIQVLLTTTLSAVIVYAFTGNARLAVFSGFLVSLSSTAIVLKILSEKGETDAPHGRTMLGILIFQDICVVPMMLLIPALSGQGIEFFDISIKIGKALVIIVFVLLSARWFVPYILHHVVHTKSRELFITTIIFLCIGTALLTAKLGLSFALGAFLAGLIISESEYAHQATADILPFKESFMGLFFVSVGMLINPGYVTGNIENILPAVTAMFLLKVFTCSVSPYIIGIPLKTSLQAGLGLAQIGEFSFVLAIAGKSAGILSNDFYQIFLSSAIITMTVTPLALKYSANVSLWIISMPFLKRMINIKEFSEENVSIKKKHDHVIIVGFGLNGRNLAGVLRDVGIPYVALEMNSDTVLEMKKKNVPIYFGDGTSSDILRKLGIENARMLVVAISDPASARSIVSIARNISPHIKIIVRTRYVTEVEDLKALGANEVIPEEFETSIEIFSRVLEGYNYPDDVIVGMMERVRGDSYKALRTVQVSKRHIFDKSEFLPEIVVRGYKIPEASHLHGKSIAELQIRKMTGGTVIAVRRNNKIFSNPDPDFRFKSEDVIFFTGEKYGIAKMTHYLNGSD
jgi:CPA2 family monovalent cation:H+ antiporter-2